MANTLGIQEITMLQAVTITTAINTRAARPSAIGTGGPLIVRITNHTDNDAAETGADTEKMAIFRSRQFGQPWVKDYGLKHIVSDGNAALTSATVIFPAYDYSTF